MNEFRFIFACKNSLATIKLPVSVGIKKIHYTYDVTLLSTLRFRLISIVPRSPAFRLGHVTAVAMFNGGVHGQAMGSEYYIYMGRSITFFHRGMGHKDNLVCHGSPKLIYGALLVVNLIVLK